jgi:hypothetical protein
MGKASANSICMETPITLLSNLPSKRCPFQKGLQKKTTSTLLMQTYWELYESLSLPVVRLGGAEKSLLKQFSKATAMKHGWTTMET